ncbi:MAG: primosomal protein N', partial [Crocinitomicaceae bacterium]|nr:primosomal protein N' [Crocinitomicaceae bacterium]
MSERKTFFANILIPVPVHEVFTYRIPFEMNGHVMFGQRVIVPFGKSKLQTGIIVEIHERIPKNYQAKYIEYLLDDEPIITNSQFKLWKWISSYYMSPLGDVMNASLPANFKLSSETVIILHPDFDGIGHKIDEKSKLIIDSLEVKDQLNLKEISELLGIKTVQPIIKKLIENNIVISQEALKERYSPKTVSCYQVSETFKDTDLMNEFISSIENKSQKKKQLDSLLILINESSKINNAVLKKTLVEKGANLSSLMTLEKNGIIETIQKKISRLQNIEQTKNSIPNLSSDQKKAYLSIKDHFKQKMVCLLHGVTGSGKTTVYIHLIQEQLKKGKQVLYLIPEIALTTQLITRLSVYFGEQIGVYHSRFNQNERIEIWNNVLRNNKNKYRIIIGARSAVFLPYHELGLIIIDEEHENTFKQTDPSPRYHGRDVSLILAQQQNAKVLLGTATPSLESYNNAVNDKFGLVELH